MKIKSLLKVIKKISEVNNLSEPFICGGTPRDKVLGKIKENLNDLDLTTGNKDIFSLAEKTEEIISQKMKIHSHVAKDGHRSMKIKDLKLDFSSNYIDPKVPQNLSDFYKEFYSRDFTCNALIMDFDFKSIKDPTKMGIDDINKKIIKTCLSPEITLTGNRASDVSKSNRVYRAIYLAAKLDFDIDKSIIKFVLNNPDVAIDSKVEFIKKTLYKAMDLNADRTLFYLREMGLNDFIASSFIGSRSLRKLALLK